MLIPATGSIYPLHMFTFFRNRENGIFRTAIRSRFYQLRVSINAAFVGFRTGMDIEEMPVVPVRNTARRKNVMTG